MDQPLFSLASATAHWVAPDLFLWDLINLQTPGVSQTLGVYSPFSLAYAPGGGLRIGSDGPLNGEEFPLYHDPSPLSEGLAAKFPHLAGKSCLRLVGEALGRVPEFLKGQTALIQRDVTGKVVQASSIQCPGVLDELFAYAGPLGLAWEQEARLPVLRLWAPTARSVRLLLYADSHPRTRPAAFPMELDPSTGVWSIAGLASWKERYYLYEVEVYVPALDQVVFNRVTDPYSISLSTNSMRSQVVDLEDSRWMPPGWQSPFKPAGQDPVDQVIYELHVRDFSAFDETVPSEARGTYTAFTYPDSHGMRHLRALQQAGLTHIHLQPVFDFTTVNEDRSKWESPDPAELAALPPDSGEQQRLVSATRARDGFNWGYDPFHYTTPEGSYAVHPDGASRLLEFRQMVQSLHEAGLGVIMDVVYNHTTSSGQGEHSVLDKIVPGYYYRRNGGGWVENSTCCSNTASEHAMFEKLMIDSLRVWAKAYKIDGFRFDLMGHHLLSNMLHARDALHSLTLERDGVNGESIYLYGEGWDFGEVARNARGANASQINCAGSGIGTFNDRLRDAIRGGRPFGGVQEQGFVTGLYTESNGSETTRRSDLKARLLYQTLWIQLGLAGGLRDFEVLDPGGRPLKGWDVDYNGLPAGYTLEPQENVLYDSAHDNETLFDAIQLKAAAKVPLAERIRMHMLALSLVALGQGVPFFLAGDDLLRSKSLDRNSYDSGDWFNRLDFSAGRHNFGAGLPPASENLSLWELMQPLLANPDLKPSPENIRHCKGYFQELLRIRKSSPLFRLRTAGQVRGHLSFYNSGAGQIPGLIVMELRDLKGEIDPYIRRMVVLFNARSRCILFCDPSFEAAAFSLHPVQYGSIDHRTRLARFVTHSGAFHVPGRTASVFVENRNP